ncbi:MAG: PQQ-binding-like beta-propeller repeat protein, partial [Verrucomicrobiota bacterium]
MPKNTTIFKSALVISVVTLCLCASFVGAAEKTVNWPQFRGPQAAGIAHGFETPTRWNVETKENLTWKTPIPGMAHACPIVWRERIYLITAISGKKEPGLKVGLYGNIASVDDDTVHRWQLLCLDKTTGKILWTRTGFEGVPKVKRHTKASHANSTPATDGRYIVTFLGSEGLFCYTMEGKEVWKRDLGNLDAGFFRVPEAQWGFASSPVIHGDMVIVQCDVQKGSFVAAYHLLDGKPIWKTERKEVPTWSTPAVHTGKHPQIVLNGWKHIGGYDIQTGKEIWKLEGGGDIPVPT